MTTRRSRPTEPVGPTDDQLARGRRFVADLDRAQWSIGDLAVEVCGPPPACGQHDTNREALVSFAEQIGIAPTRLAEYRSVSAAWPGDQRIEGASWSLHRGLVSRDDRAEYLGAFLDDCRQEGVTPTRDRLRSWFHPAGPDEEPQAKSMRRVLEIIAHMKKLDEELDDEMIGSLIVDLPAEVRLDDNEAVATWRLSVIEPDTDPWEVVEWFGPPDHGQPRREWGGCTPAEALAINLGEMYQRWNRRQHPVENDLWEDRS